MCSAYSHDHHTHHGSGKPSLRRQLYLALETSHTTDLPHRILRGMIVGMILLSVISVVLETVKSLKAEFNHVFDAIEIIAIGCFTVEYLVRVWVSIEDRAPGFSHPVWGRVRYMLSPMAIIDLLAILPPLLTFAGAHHWLAIRLLSLARMLKIMRYSPAMRTMAMAIYSERKAALAVLIIMGMSLTLLSTIMWAIEHKAQPVAFGSIPAAMWWGMATLTTIGYGDVVPITPLGKVVGAIAGLTGVAMFAMPAAILASGFIREMNRQGFRVTFAAVSNLPLMASLDASVIADVADRLQPHTVPPRFAIIRRGEEPQALYLIQSGEVEVGVPWKPVKVLKPGQAFGAIEMVRGSERPQLSATALTECRLLELPQTDFIEMFNEYPSLRQAVVDHATRADGAIFFEGAAEALAALLAEETAATDKLREEMLEPLAETPGSPAGGQPDPTPPSGSKHYDHV